LTARDKGNVTNLYTNCCYKDERPRAEAHKATMSASNGAEQKSAAASHLRPRHQISRSISELSPIHLHRHNHSGHHSSSHSRREKPERAGERDDQIYHSRSAGSAVIFQPRTSLEVPRWEGTDSLTPGTPSPDQSRRTSALIASGDEQMGHAQEAGSGTTLYTRKLSRDEEVQEERRKAAVRTRYVSVNTSSYPWTTSHFPCV